MSEFNDYASLFFGQRRRTLKIISTRKCRLANNETVIHAFFYKFYGRREVAYVFRIENFPPTKICRIFNVRSSVSMNEILIVMIICVNVEVTVYSVDGISLGMAKPMSKLFETIRTRRTYRFIAQHFKKMCWP